MIILTQIRGDQWTHLNNTPNVWWNKSLVRKGGKEIADLLNFDELCFTFTLDR